MGRVSVSGEEDGVAEAAAENLAQPGWGTLLHELLHDTSWVQDAMMMMMMSMVEKREGLRARHLWVVLSAMALLVLLRALSSARAFSINISRSSTSSEPPSSYIKISCILQ